MRLPGPTPFCKNVLVFTGQFYLKPRWGLSMGFSVMLWGAEFWFLLNTGALTVFEQENYKNLWSCRGAEDRTMNSYTTDPQFKSTGNDSSALGQGILSSLLAST